MVQRSLYGRNNWPFKRDGCFVEVSIRLKSMDQHEKSWPPRRGGHYRETAINGDSTVKSKKNLLTEEELKF